MFLPNKLAVIVRRKMYIGNRQVVNGMSLTMKNYVNVTIEESCRVDCFQDNYFFYSTIHAKRKFVVCVLVSVFLFHKFDLELDKYSTFAGIFIEHVFYIFICRKYLYICVDMSKNLKFLLYCLVNCELNCDSRNITLTY